jgi:phage terminase large subunit-like protein
MSPYAQSFGHMNPPIRELERLIMGKKIHHNGNRVMDWMFSNVTTRQDPSGNVKFDKEKSREKIDGMVGLAMAVGEWLTDNAENQNWEPLITEIKW